MQKLMGGYGKKYELMRPFVAGSTDKRGTTSGGGFPPTFRGYPTLFAFFRGVVPDGKRRKGGIHTSGLSQMSYCCVDSKTNSCGA